MSRSSKRANRLLQIEALLLSHPEGLTPAELARKLQVNRSTVGRYLADLPGHIYLDDLDGGKWKIDREGYLVNVRFNLHEALAVHLAARPLREGFVDPAGSPAAAPPGERPALRAS